MIRLSLMLIKQSKKLRLLKLKLKKLWLKLVKTLLME